MQILYSGNASEASLEHKEQRRVQHLTKQTPILLKWPGGKRAVLKQLLPFIPATFRHYYEPFLGSGALFFTLLPDHASLSDANKNLINCYIQVQNHPSHLIDLLSHMPNTQKDYYHIRQRSPTDPCEQAARFIYLMTLSFNGIHRVNRQGQFNVPYNYKTHLNPGDPEKIIRASQALARASITSGDFEDAVKDAGPGDFIYFDPPYTVLGNPGSFTKYNDVLFSWDDQQRLAQLAGCLAQRGCYVLVSNAHDPALQELYLRYGFRSHIITRPSVIAAQSQHRKNIDECLFYRSRKDPC